MGKKKFEKSIARLIKRIQVAPEPDHNGPDYRFLAVAGLEVAELAMAATRDELWVVDAAAVILGDAMAEAAHTGPERWIDRIEGPAKALAQAGRQACDDPDDTPDDDLEPDFTGSDEPVRRVLH